jgi:hypothetical protein
MRVFAGISTACLVDEQARLRCWGDSSNSKFGAAFEPFEVEGLSTVEKLAIGETHVCALGRVAGEPTHRGVSCWGNALNHRLGASLLGTRDASMAYRVSVPNTVMDVSSTRALTCAVSTSGLHCWGASNVTNERLLGAAVAESGPVHFALGGLAPIGVSVGAEHACVTGTTGSVRCWGDPSRGAVGAAGASEVDLLNLTQGISWSSSSALNARINGQSLNAQAARAGRGGLDMTCLLQGPSGSAAHQVACFGASDTAEFDGNQPNLGLCYTRASPSGAASGSSTCAASGTNFPVLVGTTADLQALPALPLAWGSGEHAVQLEMGGDFGCARSNLGTVRCWGRATDQRLGPASPATRASIPVTAYSAPTASDLATDLALGDLGGCVVVDSYRLRCWGGLAPPAAASTYDGRN